MVGPAEGHHQDGKGFNPYAIWLPVIEYSNWLLPTSTVAKRATGWWPVRIDVDSRN